jgi:hypothetical protein
MYTYTLFEAGLLAWPGALQGRPSMKMEGFPHDRYNSNQLGR